MTQLLTILADCLPHSFSQLTHQLQLTDEQLLQKINELQQQGIQINTAFGEVKMLNPCALLNYPKIQAAFPAYHIYYQPVIHSTNQFILDNISKLKKGDICLTEHQTAGRGRRGKRWQSPFASLAIFSFMWQVDAHKPLDGLSLVVGMAISDVLQKLGCEAMVKWPNDILYQGRKLAGILIEVANIEQDKINLVVGVGMNIAVPKLQNQIDQPWANLQESLPDIDRSALLILLLDEIYRALFEFEQQGLSFEFQQKWQQRDQFYGQEVNIFSGKEIITGKELGIDKSGHLCLLSNDGKNLTFNGGEVSLRSRS